MSVDVDHYDTQLTLVIRNKKIGLGGETWFGKGTCSDLTSQFLANALTRLQNGALDTKNTWRQEDSENVILASNIVPEGTAISIGFEYGEKPLFGFVVGIDHKRNQVLVSWMDSHGKIKSAALPSDRRVGWRLRTLEELDRLL